MGGPLLLFFFIMQTFRKIGNKSSSEGGCRGGAIKKIQMQHPLPFAVAYMKGI